MNTDTDASITTFVAGVIYSLNFLKIDSVYCEILSCTKSENSSLNGSCSIVIMVQTKSKI